MKYTDTLYGEQEINEPWVLEIINHPDFLRLKGISQYGYIKPYHPEATTSRYDHSIGVFLLLRKFGLSRKEQLAGLLHDISHMVFSHSIDYALDRQTAEMQTHQDDSHEEYVRSISVSELIKKYKFSISDVVCYKDYQALELELPDLCADRIDYILRDAISFGVIKKNQAVDVLDGLMLRDGIWIFKDIVKAKVFAYLFKKMNNDFYAASWTANMHITVGSYVGYALEKEYIEKADLYLTDEEVIKKINRNIDDAKLDGLWQMMNKPDFSLDRKNYDVLVKTKSRIVDPWFMYHGKQKRFSAVDESWKKAINKELLAKEYFIKYNK